MYTSAGCILVGLSCVCVRVLSLRERLRFSEAPELRATPVLSPETPPRVIARCVPFQLVMNRRSRLVDCEVVRSNMRRCVSVAYVDR